MLKYNQLISFKKDKKNYSGILLDSNLNKLVISKLTEYKEIKCWIIGNDSIEESNFFGTTFLKDEQVIYGPEYKGMSLFEILNHPDKNSVYLIIKLIKSLILIKNKLGKMPEFQSNSIFFLDTGKILIISHEIFKKIKDISSPEYNLNTYSILNHPYLTDSEEQISFIIGIVIYKILTNTFIYSGKSEDEINSKIRNLEIIEPDLYEPKLKKHISDYLYSFFNKKKYSNVKIEDWLKILNQWENEGFFNEISNIEEINKKENLVKKQSLTHNKYIRKVFWEKNGKPILTITAVSLISFIVILFFILNYFKPKSTKGYSPVQVVEAYYNSFNTLQHYVMEDCITDKADNGVIREVLALFVTNRQTMGYQNKSYIVPAYTWDKQGRPALDSPYFLYGIINLKTESIQDQKEPVFIVDYEKWNTKIIENQVLDKSPTRLINGTKIKEKVYLKNKNSYWVIYKIDLIEQYEIK